MSSQINIPNQISIIGMLMDSVEINPILDVANKTEEPAVGLTLSALGKSIL